MAFEFKETEVRDALQNMRSDPQNLADVYQDMMQIFADAQRQAIHKVSTLEYTQAQAAVQVMKILKYQAMFKMLMKGVPME